MPKHIPISPMEILIFGNMDIENHHLSWENHPSSIILYWVIVQFFMRVYQMIYSFFIYHFCWITLKKEGQQDGISLMLNHCL